MRHAAEVAVLNACPLEGTFALRMELAASHAVDSIVDRNKIQLVGWNRHASLDIAFLGKVCAFEDRCWSRTCKHRSLYNVKLIEIMRVQHRPHHHSERSDHLPGLWS